MPQSERKDKKNQTKQVPPPFFFLLQGFFPTETAVCDEEDCGKIETEVDDPGGDCGTICYSCAEVVAAVAVVGVGVVIERGGSGGTTEATGAGGDDKDNDDEEVEAGVGD